MTSSRTAMTEDLEAELVIIGGGGAGLAAAVAGNQKLIATGFPGTHSVLLLTRSASPEKTQPNLLCRIR